MLRVRRAKYGDFLRHSPRRNYRFQLNRAECRGGTVLGNLTADFSKGITAVVGRNGVGKSTLIQSISDLFHAESSARTRFNNLEKDSRWTVRCTVKGDEHESAASTREFSEGCGWDVKAFLYDPGNLVQSLQQKFRAEDNLQELLEQHAKSFFEGEEKQVIEFIANCEYDSISVISIENEYPDFPLLPFFEVSRGGVSYDTRDMGQGELACIYFVWLLVLLEKSAVDQNCLLLLEEPESFLPPISQARLSMQLAYGAGKLGVQVICATHSEHILGDIPESNIRVQFRSPDGVAIECVENARERFRSLRMSAPKLGLIIVEDQAACCFARAILNASSRFCADDFHVRIAGDSSKVVEAVKGVPSDLGDFSFLGNL